MLVVENIENENDIDFVNKLSLRFNILVTSRVTFPAYNNYKIDKMGNDAKNLFYKYSSLKKLENESKLEDLLEFLDMNPFFIKKTAQALYNSNTLTLDKLLEKKNFFNIDNIQENRSFKNYLLELYPLDYLDKESIAILKKIALLPPIEIEFLDLIKLLDIQDLNKFDRLINSISQKGLIEKAGKHFKLHNIMKEYILSQYSINYYEVKTLIDKLVLLSEPSLNNVNSRIISYCYSVVEAFCEKGPFIPVFLNNIAMYYFEKGLNTKALRFQLKSLNINKKYFKNDSLELAPNYKNLSLIYKEQNDLPQALKLLKKSLKIYRLNLPRYHNDIAITYTSISSYYSVFTDKKNKKKSLIYKLLSIKCIENNNTFFQKKKLAKEYDDLAYIYYSCDDFESTIKYLFKSINFLNKNDLETFPKLFESYALISFLYKISNDFEKEKIYELESKKYFIEEKRKQYKVASLFSIFSLYYLKKREYVKALQFQFKAYKEDKYDLNKLNNIIQIYYKYGNLKKSIKWGLKRMFIVKEKFGNTDEELIIPHTDLALFYFELDDFSNAIKFQKVAIDLILKNFGETYIKLPLFYSNLGYFYFLNKQALMGLPYSEKAIVLNKQRKLDTNELLGYYKNLYLIYKEINDPRMKDIEKLLKFREI